MKWHGHLQPGPLTSAARGPGFDGRQGMPDLLGASASCRHGWHWRPYRPEDETALREAHQRQCAAGGEGFAFPDFRDPRYVWALVGERGDQVLGAIVAHATLELMFVGGDAGLVRDAVRRRHWLEEQLRGLGADEAHAFVPRRQLRAMRPLLHRLGFRPSAEGFVPFYREL